MKTLNIISAPNCLRVSEQKKCFVFLLPLLATEITNILALEFSLVLLLLLCLQHMERESCF